MRDFVEDAINAPDVEALMDSTSSRLRDLEVWSVLPDDVE